MNLAGLVSGGPSPAPFSLRAARPALVVDDASFDRRRLIRLCEQAGLHLDFTEAASLTEMRQAIAESTFEVVFIDFRLPDGDGLEALEMLRADPAHRDAATVMIAGERDFDVAVEALHRGCDDYLGKGSMSAELLGRTVSLAIDRLEMARALTRAAALTDVHLSRMTRLSRVARNGLRADLELLALACGDGAAEAAALKRLRSFLDEFGED
jgi:CheY-like chemotaxis protein